MYGYLAGQQHFDASAGGTGAGDPLGGSQPSDPAQERGNVESMADGSADLHLSLRGYLRSVAWNSERCQIPGALTRFDPRASEFAGL